MRAFSHRAFCLIPTLALLVAGGTGCDSITGADRAPTVTFSFDLDRTADAGEWTAGFSDYAPQMEEAMDLQSGHALLPESFGMEGKKGLFISARNHSDDVFMFWTSRVTGLEPDRWYQVDFEVEFATEAPAECVGVGGAPGESVWVKAGVAEVEPEAALATGGGEELWLMNVDKGNQANGGPDAHLLGDIGIASSDCLDWKWGVKTLVSSEPFDFRTDASGAGWILLGTDSGFEGTTRLFYTRLEAVFRPL